MADGLRGVARGAGRRGRCPRVVGRRPSTTTAQDGRRPTSLHGFLVLDHLDRVAEAGAHLGELIAAGKLHHDETLVDGLEKARDALSQILDGEKLGTMIVRVSETR
jgi:NADPH-dependent curcumin reductase CurA